MAHDKQGLRFAWREAGHGHNPAVVLLHGLGGSRLSWEPQLATVAGLAEEFRALAWEVPGYGDSAAPLTPFSFPTLAQSVVDFLDDTQIGRCHLVGISFGSMIAQYATAAFPHRFISQTLLATSPCFGLDGTKPDEWRVNRLAPLDAGIEPSGFAERVLGNIAGPHITPEAMNEQILAMQRVTGTALRRSIDCLITHDSRQILGTITVPTQVICGELDNETPPLYGRAVADAIPYASFTVIANAGHLLNVEAPIQINNLIRDHAQKAAAS